jgi:hypothetical protein
MRNKYKATTTAFLILSFSISYAYFSRTKSIEKSDSDSIATADDANKTDEQVVRRNTLKSNQGPGQNVPSEAAQEHAESIHIMPTHLESAHNADVTSPIDKEDNQRGPFVTNGLYEDAAERQKFLAEKEMARIEDWDNYEKFTADKFDENSLTGKFSGKLDDNKGTIDIDFNGRFVSEVFEGKISVVLKDIGGSTLTHSESDNSNLGRVVRYDPKYRSMLIRVHRKSRYVFQIFETDSKDILLGNIYDDTPERGFRIFGRFISYRI